MRFLPLLFLLFASPAFALTFEIIGACSEQPAAQGIYAAAPGMNAGEVTVNILEREKIPYIGSAGGMNSIYGTPTGDEAIEVLSDSEMRAYGWCYEVDNEQPSLMPDKVTLNGNEHLKWFYAFSHYKAGEWLSYCTPAYTVKPAALCR